MEVLSSRILLRPSELERSLQFYEEVLGFAVYREWGEGKSRGVVFFLGGGLLEVAGSSAEAPSDAVRLFLQVRDLRSVRELLVAAGVAIEQEPEVRRWGLFEMVVRDPMGSRSSSSRCRPSTRFAGEADFDADRPASRTHRLSRTRVYARPGTSAPRREPGAPLFSSSLVDPPRRRPPRRSGKSVVANGRAERLVKGSACFLSGLLARDSRAAHAAGSD